MIKYIQVITTSLTCPSSQLEAHNFLPWILSSMAHTIIAYGLYGYYTSSRPPSSLPQLVPLLVSLMLVLVPQGVVWVAWCHVAGLRGGGGRQGGGEEECALVMDHSCQVDN